MFYIYPDAQITRRKRHHVVMQEPATVVYRSRFFHHVLQYLAEHSQQEAVVVGETEAYIIRLRRRPLMKGEGA